MSDSTFLGFSDVWCFLGFITSILFSIVPIFQILPLILRQKQIETISFLPSFSMLSNCGLWFFYSLSKILKNESGGSVNPLDYCNLIGFCFCSIWCVIIMYYKNIQSKVNFIIFLFIFLGGTAIIIVVEYLMITKDNETTCETIVRFFATAYNILMYIAPGLNSWTALKMRNFVMIPVEYAIMGFINALIWLIWAARSDNVGGLIDSIVCNSLAIILTIAQIVIFIKFKRDYEKSHAKDIDKDLMQEKEREKEKDIERKSEQENKSKSVLPEEIEDL